MLVAKEAIRGWDYVERFNSLIILMEHLVNGPTFVSDGTNISYFQFDGTFDDRADFSYLIKPAYQTTTDFTWCLWYNPNVTGNRIIIGNRHNSASNGFA